MHNILEKIILHKAEEVKKNKDSISVNTLEKSTFFTRETYSLKHSLLKGYRSGIIAEHKRKSPSKGIINDRFTVEEVVQGYEKANASAVSILTDKEFFAGKDADILLTRSMLPIPVLRKEFIIDPYQIIEAKSMGADLILLIAACLSPAQCKSLAKFARELGLEVLLEVHDGLELENHLNEYVDLLGVNNRNLKTFEVSIQTSLELADKIPQEFVKISESGLSNAKDIVSLKNVGFKGFLIGESFMKTDNPGEACAQLAKEIELAYSL